MQFTSILVGAFLALSAQSFSTSYKGNSKEPAITSKLGTLNCTYTNNVTMPLGDSGLSAPPPGQELLHIGIGRGTLV